jgi:hypothetical protein
MIWLALGAKMVATAAIVVASCLVVERTSPLVGALVATLPISAGPAYIFLALEHGGGFIAEGTPASLASIGATAFFATVYGALARTRGRLVSTAAALGVWLVVVTVLRAAAPGLGAIAVADVVIFATGIAVTARWRRAPSIGRVRSSPWDIPVRAGATMALVGAVVVTGRALGPGAAGLLALAPVVLVSLALLLHPRIGGAAAAAVMANTLHGLAGYIPAMTLMALIAPRFGATLALLAALTICLGWNGALLAVARRRRTTAPARSPRCASPPPSPPARRP